MKVQISEDMKALREKRKELLENGNMAKRIGVSLQATANERLVELMRVGSGLLPVWVRAPVTGPEHYTGFSRAKLYELASKRLIRSVSIREPHQIRGTRLFNLASILDFIERCEREAIANGSSGGDTESAP